MEYLKLKKSNCRNCHKCIRHCPVKAIRFTGNQAYINPNECILCGTCFVVCPQNAKQIVDETERVKELLRSGAPVIASLAPSFIANYEGCGIESMREALKKLGFADVQETALGATQVKREFDRMLEEEDRDVIITSCCNSVNLLIQRYYPSLLGYLADVVSPMQAHCRRIKEENPGAKTVFIGPCVAKMEEAERYPGLVDAVLNFDQLTAWMNAEGIVPEKKAALDGKGLARFFPTPGGVMKTMELKNRGYTYMAVDGIENCIMCLDDLKNQKLHHCFIEMNACSGSCIGGPIMEKYKRTPVADYVSVARYAGEKDFDVEQPSVEQMRKHFQVEAAGENMPTEEEITAVLRQMGKTGKRDELNCGTCGYNTCRDKAIAVCQGKAEITMCLPYLMSRTESFSGTVLQNMPSALLVMNENLELQEMNQAAVHMMEISSAADVLGEDAGVLMDPADFVEVLTTGRGIRDKQIYLEKQDRYASETVIYNREYHILICMLRDITRDTRQKALKESRDKQTVEVADQVIAHQMRIVQDIASLLGETAAETKIALTRLKESIHDE